MKENSLVVNGKKYVIAREAKSERLQLLVRPSTKEGLVEIADTADISLNELANRIFEDFIEDSREK